MNTATGTSSISSVVRGIECNGPQAQVAYNRLQPALKLPPLSILADILNPTWGSIVVANWADKNFAQWFDAPFVGGQPTHNADGSGAEIVIVSGVAQVLVELRFQRNRLVLCTLRIGFWHDGSEYAALLEEVLAEITYQ